jgi:hypothetical protein
VRLAYDELGRRNRIFRRRIGNADQVLRAIDPRPDDLGEKSFWVSHMLKDFASNDPRA